VDPAPYTDFCRTQAFVPPRTQRPSPTSLPSTGPRRVAPATLSGTVNQTDRFASPVLGLATNPGIIRASFPFIHDLPAGVDALVILEARCYPGFTDDQIVKAAWNFDLINDHYRFYLDLCETRLAEFLSRDPDPQNAIALLRQERSAWN
jgi:hypothetical protein